MAGSALHRPNPPMFFKVVRRPLAQGLRIPVAFAQEHADLLDDTAATLIDPAGTVWMVQLSRAGDGRIRLGAGLEGYEQFYGLRRGHYLFFLPIAKAEFRVNILDSSATEIDYPVAGGENELCRPERPHFYHRVEDSDEEELPIPPAFVRKCGERLEDRAVVKLVDPAGNTIRVRQLTGGDGEAWFQTGWGHFINFYSMVRKEVVLFIPLGDSRYQVSIFDKFGAEIEYPVRRQLDSDAGEGTSRAPPSPGHQS